MMFVIDLLNPENESTEPVVEKKDDTKEKEEEAKQSYRLRLTLITEKGLVEVEE